MCVISFSVPACVREEMGLSLLYGNPDSEVRVAITIELPVFDPCRPHTLFTKVDIECGFPQETYESKQI